MRISGDRVRYRSGAARFCGAPQLSSTVGQLLDTASWSSGEDGEES
jgi:hypothetical protein